MPSILIVPETGSDDVPESFKLRERICVDDLGDAHICAQLLERDPRLGGRGRRARGGAGHRTSSGHP